MCGIIGFQCSVFSPKQEKLLKALLHESSVRGLHAFGMSYLLEGFLQSHKWALPLEKVELSPYLENMRGKALTLIAHCRYSTSDLNDNQPIHTKHDALVHNGVISQESPDKWKSLYGITTKSHNDSELLFRSRLSGHDPFKTWPDASIAAVELSVGGGMRFYRNGKRPLFYAQAKGLLAVFSTQDIGERAGLSPFDTIPGCIYHVKDVNSLKVSEPVSVKELQL